MTWLTVYVLTVNIAQIRQMHQLSLVWITLEIACMSHECVHYTLAQLQLTCRVEIWHLVHIVECRWKSHLNYFWLRPRRSPLTGSVCLYLCIYAWQNSSIQTLQLCIMGLEEIFEISQAPHSLMLVTYNFWGTLRSLGGYLGLTFGVLGGYFLGTLGWLWGYFGGHIGITFFQLSNKLSWVSAYWEVLCVPLEVLWCDLTLILGAVNFCQFIFSC